METLTPKEAAAHLGVRSTDTVANARKRGSLTGQWCDKINGYRYSVAELDAFTERKAIRRRAAAEKRKALAAASPKPSKHQAKVTPEDVLEIRASPDKIDVLVRRYGISKTAIRSILLGRTWKDVGGRIRLPGDFGERWKPTPEQMDLACQSMRDSGQWGLAAHSVGVATGTLKRYAATEDGKVLQDLHAEHLRRSALHDASMMTRAIEIRRGVKSWGAVAGELGMTESALTSLRTRTPHLRAAANDAANAGQAAYERSMLTRAISLISEHKAWVAVATAMGIAPGSFSVWARKHPDLAAEMKDARRAARATIDVEPAFIYVLQDGYGKIKVGRSRNVKKRAASLRQSGSSGIMEILFSEHVPDPAVEYCIHDRLAAYSIHGEWFDVPADVAVSVAREEIDNYTEYTPAPPGSPWQGSNHSNGAT